MEVLCEEKQLLFCPWMNKPQEGHEFTVHGCLETRGEKKKTCVWVIVIFPFHSEVNYGWSVRGGMDGQSCHPTPKTINYHNFPQLPAEIINCSGWVRQKEENTWVFSLMAKV